MVWRALNTQQPAVGTTWELSRKPRMDHQTLKKGTGNRLFLESSSKQNKKTTTAEKRDFPTGLQARLKQGGTCAAKSLRNELFKRHLLDQLAV